MYSAVYKHFPYAKSETNLGVFTSPLYIAGNPTSERHPFSPSTIGLQLEHGIGLLA